MSDTKKRSNFLEIALVVALVYFASQFVMQTFFPSKEQQGSAPEISLTPVASSWSIGHFPELTLKNGGSKAISLAAKCPDIAFDVARIDHAGEKNEKRIPLKPREAIDCVVMNDVPPGETRTISLAPWKYSLFEEIGTYEVRLKQGSGALTARFSMTEPNALVKVFRTFITRPFLNFLILIASVTPGHNLGVAIIVLTIVVKLLLYYPTQKSLEGQKKMQKLQPLIEELKQRFGSDKKLLQEETMKLWKEHKVNPFSSCLPLLIQFPILIGLFYVIKDGSNLSLSREFIYPFYQHLPWGFGMNFLGLNLTEPEYYVTPAMLVILQFIQMKLSFAQAKKKQEETAKKEQAAAPGPDAMQQKIMLYALPLMIGFFAFQFPAAVSLYYGMSTLFAIGQQIVVNRKTA